MSGAAPILSRKQRHIPWIWILAAILIFALGYLASICVQIEVAASQQQLHAADALVVFGAAEYSGRPSPVYRARLDHALELFQRGVAPVIITTGGAAADPEYNEGGVGHDYLMHRGVPEANLIAETQGSDTAQSAVRVAVIMRANHMRSCVAVSDAYHVFRIRQLLEHQGVEVYVAPRPDSRPHSWPQRGEAVLREATSYVLWQVHVNR
ncbi:MAG: YdcF family protein [Acidobacteriaceae bacterium]|nr:YdcF family protein [Acidobacteriaceae bacterium]